MSTLCKLRLWFIALIVSLLSSVAVAHTDGIYNPTANSVGDTQGIDSNGAGAVVSCTPGTQATNFLARTSGLNATETKAYCNLINGLVADGIITGTLSGAAGCGSILDELYIFATNTTTTANLNLCGTSFGLTQTGTVTFTADQGYQGDGSTGFLNIGRAPSGGTNFLQNSASLGSYILNARTTDQNYVAIGSTDSVSYAYQQPKSAGAFFYEVNSATFPSFVTANTKGAWISSRTASNAYALYLNGSSTAVSSAANASIAPNANNILIGALGGGAVTDFSTDQIAAAFVGGALTGAQAVLINNRINAFMLVFGKNVY